MGTLEGDVNWPVGFGLREPLLSGPAKQDTFGVRSPDCNQ